MRLEYLTANDWALLRSKSRELSFRPGEAIITINSRPEALFVIRTGGATIEVTRGEAIARLAAGDICGEMSFIEDSVASASVVAEKETKVDALELDALKDIFSSFPHLEARFYRSLALLLSRRLRKTSADLAKSQVKPKPA
ncbi:MAG TPA: cyclic nucleotide-binding domain-containing protein [Alphaproteobacteria bacterium]|nr:cyclic nucleotide-binding domain-containing protein [Alphaproteobacteria bacterium]